MECNCTLDRGQRRIIDVIIESGKKHNFGREKMNGGERPRGEKDDVHTVQAGSAITGNYL